MGMVGGGVDFSLGQFFLMGGFGDCFVVGSINDLVGMCMGLIDDFVGFGVGFFQCFVDFFLCLGQIFLVVVGSSEVFSNFLLVFFDCVYQWWLDFGCDDLDQISEGQCLCKKGEIDIYGQFDCWFWGGCVVEVVYLVFI